MTSYLRLRLSKIQSQVWTLGSWTLDTWAFDTDLLSREELTFAKSYREEASTCDIRKDQGGSHEFTRKLHMNFALQTEEGGGKKSQILGDVTYGRPHKGASIYDVRREEMQQICGQTE